MLFVISPSHGELKWGREQTAFPIKGGMCTSLAVMERHKMHCCMRLIPNRGEQIKLMNFIVSKLFMYFVHVCAVILV